MHLTKSPSGSAEYLPLDSYNGEGTRVSVSGTSAVPELSATLTGDSSSLHMARGKAVDISDQDFNADSPTSDDGVLVGITRSSTWKRQSMILIQERDKLGPALPQIPNDLDEVDEISEEEVVVPSDVSLSVPRGSTADRDDLSELMPVAVAPALGNAPSMEDAFVTGVYATDAPNTAVVTDYFDILDFIDAKEHPDIGIAEKNDEDDGHISSDLLANSDSSDIDLSGDDGTGSSDSDDQYLSKIGQQRMLRVANVVDAPRADGGLHSSHARSDSTQQPADNAMVVDGRSSVVIPDADADAEAGSAVGRGSHSTLRRSRRILTKGKSIRRGLSSQQSTRAPPVVSAQPAEASLNVSIPENRPVGRDVPSPRWSVVDADEQVLASQRVSAPSAYLTAHSAVARARVAAPSTRPDSLFSAARSGPQAEPAQMAAVDPVNPGVPAPIPGLAKLAEAAQAAAAAVQISGTRTTRGLSVSAIGGARHKPLPPVPDRISRTLQAADSAAAAAAAHEALAGSSNIATARPGRAPPPLPAKARPKIPQMLAGDKLSTRAAIAAALERPSSQTLFGVDAMRASSQQASLEHMSPEGVPGMHRAATTQPAPSAADASPLSLQAWLQRTDILAPATSIAAAAAKPAHPLIIPEGSSVPLERPASQQHQVHTPRPMTAARRKSMRARSRVVRKVAVPSLPLQEPTPRPVSSNSSIHSSASHENGPSPPTSPVLAPNSQTLVSAALVSETPHMAITSTTAAHSAYPYPYEHEPMPATAGPTVLSAPPGSNSEYPPGALGSELLEPSAPMLVEPTAPELPEQWNVVSPHSYAFPQPMHYEVPSAPQYAYGAVPGMAPGHAPMGFALPLATPPQLHMHAHSPLQAQAHTMPMAATPVAMLSPGLNHQRRGPPKLPEKPRP
ncbi:hypothetical protein GGI24_003859, partial [Coemansia furcata]